MIRAKHSADEQNRVWQILGCSGARLNPELAETLAFNSTVSASVACGVLENTVPKDVAHRRLRARGG